MLKKLFVTALMSISVISSAHALENVGLFNGTGFLINGYTASADSARSQLLVVQPDGQTEKVVLEANCTRKTFTLTSQSNRQVTVPYATKKDLVRKSPTVAGYYAVYERFCPAKTVASKKCAMTDSGKLCGKTLQMYQQYD